jgi:hypothetical protein
MIRMGLLHRRVELLSYLGLRSLFKGTAVDLHDSLVPNMLEEK